MRIECVGVPGAGKSTIRDTLVRKLKKGARKKFLTIEEAFLEVTKEKQGKIYHLFLNFVPDSIARKIINRVSDPYCQLFASQNKFLAQYGRSINAFLTSSIYKQLDVDDRANVISSFLYTGSICQCVEEHIAPGAVVLFDEGLVQKSFMFVSHLSQNNQADNDRTKLYDYLGNVPLPDYLIYIKADLDICYSRMMNRPKGLTARLKHVDKDEIKKFLKNADKHLEEVFDWIKDNSNIELVKVDNVDEVSRVVSKLEDELRMTF